MPTKYWSTLLPFWVLLVGAGTVGCSPLAHNGIHQLNISYPGVKVTKIRDIPQNQNTIDTVYLRGKVTNQAPLLDANAYELKDATSTIWVVSQGTLPNIGDQVLIQGKPQFQSIPIAGQDLGEFFVQELEQLKRQVYQPKSPLLPAPTDEQ
ncbi:hypothetical protein [Moorena sp. SIO3H5]|uniref:hypothetical protein n=1 Tax=Moorena sp. SIO3H5 TaxID=2607834 RepID=UPI0013B9D7D6|nr:hypothetical protein [Moorena sp. SIO3H5]NEO68182.1 hypothetical protein [Moorena sp. SIO3H5]